jgi:hypothetical protein
MTDKQPIDRWLGKEIKGGIGKNRFNIYLVRPV